MRSSTLSKYGNSETFSQLSLKSKQSTNLARVHHGPKEKEKKNLLNIQNENPSRHPREERRKLKKKSKTPSKILFFHLFRAQPKSTFFFCHEQSERVQMRYAPARARTPKSPVAAATKKCPPINIQTHR